MTRADEIIRSSEIAQYAYCARAWWLGRVLGYRSANLEAMRDGTAGHRAHGRAVQGYHSMQRLAVALLLLAVLLLVAWIYLGAGR